MSLKQGLIILGVQASKVQDDIGDFGNPKCYGMEAKTDASTDNVWMKTKTETKQELKDTRARKQTYNKDLQTPKAKQSVQSVTFTPALVHPKRESGAESVQMSCSGWWES